MDIIHSPAGKIVKSIQGYNAFIPNNLPPAIEWDASVVNSLSRADFVLGALTREGAGILRPHMFVQPFIAREAVLSSRIEGTRTTLSEMLVAEAVGNSGKNGEDFKEVQNYIKALDYGLQRLQELPVSLRLIKEMHQILMEGVRGNNAKPGEFRKNQNWIGSPGSTINTAKFVPPPPDHLLDCLNSLENFLHDRQLPPLIHIALCHYQFEAIHPFLDGNGRIGRLLTTLFLVEQKILRQPLLYLSTYFESNNPITTTTLPVYGKKVIYCIG